MTRRNVPLLHKSEMGTGKGSPPTEARTTHGTQRTIPIHRICEYERKKERKKEQKCACDESS